MFPPYGMPPRLGKHAMPRDKNQGAMHKHVRANGGQSIVNYKSLAVTKVSESPIRFCWPVLQCLCPIEEAYIDVPHHCVIAPVGPRRR